jgi:Fic family protein
MPPPPNIWQPSYTLSPRSARALMEIEAARAVVAHTALPLAVREALRQRARLRSTHFSTRIEGNRLSLAEAEQVIAGQRTRFHGRERDVREVRNYWHALLRVEDWAARGLPLTEELIRRLHGLVEQGPRAKPTPYRDGQNAIREAESGARVYLPPEARDVPMLMAELVAWVGRAEEEELPVPLVAGLVHYQFVTVHPYYDGNGRTARLLATFLLHHGGYGLEGFFSLEEHHARDLQAYYQSLATHDHHNYYEGRAAADLTPWLEYFLQTLAAVFTAAKDEALRAGTEGPPAGVEPERLRRLDPRARAVLGLSPVPSTSPPATWRGCSAFPNGWRGCSCGTGWRKGCSRAPSRDGATGPTDCRQVIGNSSAIDGNEWTAGPASPMCLRHPVLGCIAKSLQYCILE